MQIKIIHAQENNLKNLSLSIPLNKITAITGVSGSGKTTLLKNVLAAYGANNYARVSSQTVRHELMISNSVKVESISNLPQTVLIEPKSFIFNQNSTVSTLSGIHEMIRNLFTEYGETVCPICGEKIKGFNVYKGTFAVDIIKDRNYDSLLIYITKYGSISSEIFYDKKGNEVGSSKKASKVTVCFSLNNPSKGRILDINKLFSCNVYSASKEKFNPLLFAPCPKCGNILPQLSRSRLSFTTSYENGGGACQSCNGTGFAIQIDPNTLIVDKNKTIVDGGLRFVSLNGIQYTNIDYSSLKTISKYYNINIKDKIKDIDAKSLSCLIEKTRTFTINKGKGAKELIEFKGIAKTLCNAFLSGKGEKKLAEICNKKICCTCKGIRIDPQINCFSLFGKTVSDLLSMTISDLMKWAISVKTKVPKEVENRLDKIIAKTQIFSQLSCGHLELSRMANTLSGGEVQRIKIGTLLNSNINNICYLLDEPSTGLHPQDIDILGDLLKKICADGNTIVLVDHNKDMLSFCDYIIDMGSFGGDKGGAVVFSGNIVNFLKSGSETAKAILKRDIIKKTNSISAHKVNFLHFDKINVNNLKNITVKIPRDCFSVICGISGSGKSTLLNDVIYKQILQAPFDFGYKDVIHLAQRNILGGRSYVASILRISEYIASIYANGTKFSPSAFLLNSKEGKCEVCNGRGIVLSDDNEPLGGCACCQGRRFSHNVLNIKINNLSIYDIYTLPISNLKDVFEDKKIKEISLICEQLKLGYISILRGTESLSKGELQRLYLVNVITHTIRDALILLDEPSIGLHANDVKNLLSLLNELTRRKNTVIAVEHNPVIISAADYIVELGGRGNDGGNLLYCGDANKIKNTPISVAINKGFLPSKKRYINKKQEIIISFSGQVKRYKCNEIHDVSTNTESFITLYNIIKNDFLSSIIPGNVLFSNLGETTSVQWEHSPLLLNIDFSKKMKYDFSIYDILGIKSNIIALIMQKYPTQMDFLKYIFDDTSSTGKCMTCKGQGKVQSIPLDYFIEGETLSKSAKSFLSKSSTYSDFAKILKKRHGIDLHKDFSKLNNIERNLLLWGSDQTIELDKDLLWHGFIPYFLRNHVFYPDQRIATNAITQKRRIICPTCMGKMLESTYLKYNILGLNYNEILTKNIKTILEIFKTYNKSNVYIQKIKGALDLLLRFGLLDLQLSSRTTDLEGRLVGIIYTISLFINKIHSTGILFSNTSLLEDNQIKVLNKMLVPWKQSNTIFIS